MEPVEQIRLVIPSRLKYLTLVRACVAELCRQVEAADDPEQMTYNIQLAVHEGVVNAIEHAHADRPAALSGPQPALARRWRGLHPG